MKLFQWSKFDRVTFLNVVKLREKSKVNDDSFILLSQGMENMRYTGQAETLKCRKRCKIFSLHIIVLWHTSQGNAGGKNKCWCQKMLHKLMVKRV